MGMSTTIRASQLFGGTIGAFQQLVNELTARVSVPIGPIPDAPPGDVLEVRGTAQREGADTVEWLIDQIVGRRRIDPQLARSTRPLLAQATITTGAPGTLTRLVVRATAPGADWGASGRESAMVAVYVNGQYRSTIIVQSERSEPFEVALGELPAGAHRVELRAATDVAPVAAVVQDVAVRSIDGEQALIERHAPVLELRDSDAGARISSASNDAPLLLVPVLTRHADGSRTIVYQVIFSNEDCGTKAPDLYAQYGRGVDAEPVLRVELDPDGRVVSETYQAALHRWLAFDGRRDGTRPILRVSTANNLVSARSSTRSGERWGAAPIGPVDEHAAEYGVMREHPWVWKIMARELLREGKAAAADAVRGATQIADPRRYVYVGPLSAAARAAIAVAGGLEVVLADGTKVLARAVRTFARGALGQTALELPPGTMSDAVRGVALVGVQALVLNQALEMRELVAIASRHSTS